MGIILKRNVVLRAVVTDRLRAELVRELDEAIEQVDQRIQQIDFSTKPYLSELQRTNLQQAINVRKQVEAEKQKHEDLKSALNERKSVLDDLKDGDEIIRGTLESWVEIAEGDNLAELLGGVEIVTKDDLVIDIRTRSVVPGAGELEDAAPMILTDLSQM